MTSFMQSFKQDVKNDLRLYFAPVVGAFRQVRAELQRSSNVSRQNKAARTKKRSLARK